MTQSVELLLDPETDAAVRDEWAALDNAELPSLGTVAAATNRPHITLWAGDALPPGADDALQRATPDLPMPVRLGALTCFGRRRFILVRQVVADRRLLDLQAPIARLCGADDQSLLAPGRWTPHVTLALRLSAAQVGLALDVLGGSRERDATAVGWRRWDGDSRREWSLPVG
ncbi:MAG: 2'-5' RNA ligase family protein [Nocardioidaceae bacterium]